MKLQVDLQDLRYMIREKCDDIIADPKLAHEFFDRICDIEEDQRFEEVREGRWVPLTGMGHLSITGTGSVRSASASRRMTRCIWGMKC